MCSVWSDSGKRQRTEDNQTQRSNMFASILDIDRAWNNTLYFVFGDFGEARYAHRTDPAKF